MTKINLGQPILNILSFAKEHKEDLEALASLNADTDSLLVFFNNHNVSTRMLVDLAKQMITIADYKKALEVSVSERTN